MKHSSKTFTNLVFVANGIDIRVFLKKYSVTDTLFICVKPGAVVCAKEYSIDYQDTCAYFGRDGHISLHKFIVAIETCYTETLRFKDQNGASEAYQRTLEFYCRFEILRFAFLKHLCCSAVAIHKPVNIYLSSGFLDLFPQVDSMNIKKLLASELKRLSRELNIYTWVMSKSFATRIIEAVKTPIMALIYQVVIGSQNLIVEYALKRRQFVVVASDSYDLDCLAARIEEKFSFLRSVYLGFKRQKLYGYPKRLLKKEVFLFRSRPSIFSSWHPQLVDLYAAINGATETFGYKLSKCAVVKTNSELIYLKEIFAASARKSLPGLIYESGNIRRLISNPNCTLCISQSAVGRTALLGELSSIFGVPGILFSHGTHPLQRKNSFAEVEWRAHSKTLIDTSYPFVAIQSGLMANYVDNCLSGSSRPITTGSVLDVATMAREEESFLRRRLYGTHANTMILLHASTPKALENFRPIIYETIDEYVENLNRLIWEVSTVDNVFLVVRFREIASLSVHQLRALLPDLECFDIFTEGNFNEFAASCDALISYSSTAIEQCLHHKKPVILLDFHDKYVHFPDIPSVEFDSGGALPIFVCQKPSDIHTQIGFLRSQSFIDYNTPSFWASFEQTCDNELSWLSNVAENLLSDVN